MVYLNETEEKKRLKSFHEKESEFIAKETAKQIDVPYANLDEISINTDALQLIDEEYARDHGLVAFGRIGKRVSLGAKNPQAEAVKKKVEDLKAQDLEVSLYIISDPSLKKALGYYGDITSTVKEAAGEMEVANQRVSEFLAGEPSRKEAKQFVKKSLESTDEDTTSQILEILVSAAIAMDASDIHVEIDESGAAVRMRVDGVLQKISPIPQKPYSRIISRLKLLSGMKLNIHDKAQDGRFSIRLDGSDVEVRSSVVPGNYGESVVMRVLNQESIDAQLEDLGMHPTFLKKIRAEINRPNGLILNTGPTGSGKTTTLYSFLREINNPQVKTITIENPIEYHLNGVVQTQVDPEDGYDFYDGLKAAMRQDPDIIKSEKSVIKTPPGPPYNPDSPATGCFLPYTPTTPPAPFRACRNWA